MINALHDQNYVTVNKTDTKANALSRWNYKSLYKYKKLLNCVQRDKCSSDFTTNGHQTVIDQ